MVWYPVIVLNCFMCFLVVVVLFGGAFSYRKKGTKPIKTNSVANKQIIGYCKMNFLHTTFFITPSNNHLVGMKIFIFQFFE